MHNLFRLFLVITAEDEPETENAYEIEDALVISDGPWLIPRMKIFLMDMFETTYEWNDLL